MRIWMTIWTVLLVTGIGGFFALAVVIAIGGAFDIRTMIRRLVGADDKKSKPSKR